MNKTLSTAYVADAQRESIIDIAATEIAEAEGNRYGISLQRADFKLKDVRFYLAPLDGDPYYHRSDRYRACLLTLTLHSCTRFD